MAPAKEILDPEYQDPEPRSSSRGVVERLPISESPDPAMPLQQSMLNFDVYNVDCSRFLRVASEMRDETFKLYRELPDNFGPQEATVANLLTPLIEDFKKRYNFYKRFVFVELAFPNEFNILLSRKVRNIINEMDNELPVRKKLLDHLRHVSTGEQVDPEAKTFAQYLLHKYPNPVNSKFWSSLSRLRSKSTRLSKVRKRLEELNIAYQDCINACDVEELTSPVESKRKRLHDQNRGKCAKNISRMKEMNTLRDEGGRILDYQGGAEFKAKLQMGKCATCIEQLIRDLRGTVLKSAATRLEELRKLKARSFAKGEVLKGTKVDTLYDWDYTYCTNLSFKRQPSVSVYSHPGQSDVPSPANLGALPDARYGIPGYTADGPLSEYTKQQKKGIQEPKRDDVEQFIDWNRIAQYLEVERTITETILIISQLFGLRFEKLSRDDQETRVMVWHKSVKVYGVWNNTKNEKYFLGYLYLDLFSREEKSIMLGYYCLQTATSDQNPSSVISMNVKVNEDTNLPTLLEHSQLCFLFHNFGLAIHNLVNRANCPFLPDNTEEDFFEIPGVLLEQWCWEPEILERIGQHWSWNSNFSSTWRMKNSSFTGRPDRTLDKRMIKQLQTWRKDNEPLEKLKECQHAMFDIGTHSSKLCKLEKLIECIHSQKPCCSPGSCKLEKLKERIHSQKGRGRFPTIHSSVIWNPKLASRVNPASSISMEALEEEWEWGQRSARLETFRMRNMGRQSRLLIRITECARDLFETKFKDNLTDENMGRRFMKIVLKGSLNSNGVCKLWDFLGRCPKPFDQMVDYSSLKDRRTGKKHECSVYWRQILEDEVSSQSTAPDRRRSKDPMHSAGSRGSGDPKDSEELHHLEEPNGSSSTTTNSLATPGTHTHPAANMDVTIRHPVFLGSNKLVKEPKGVATCDHERSSLVAEGYMSANDSMNWKGKGLASPRPEETCPAIDRNTAITTDAQMSQLVPVTNILNALPAGVNTGGDEERSPAAPKPKLETWAIVLKKVPTIRVGGERFVVDNSAGGATHMSIPDWMMGKDKDTKWLSNSRPENEEAPEGEESIWDDGITREEKEGQSSSSSEPPLIIGNMSFG